jgi:anhydro-N-acetylmuramic acid kinase
LSTQPLRDTALYIGLMSGTSLDGVDGVLVEFADSSDPTAHDDAAHETTATASNALRVICHVAHPFSASLKAQMLSLNQSGPDELHRAALAGNALARSYAEVVMALLQKTGTPARQVRAIGAHGQTVRHRPGEFDADPATGRAATGYTLQLNNPALLAELTDIDVVADFRSRDVAAGGQGAPLVPAFHHAVFGGLSDGMGASVAMPSQAQAALATTGVLNIGGIANLTVLNAQGPESAVLGFDCGPGNALMDAWCQTHTGQAYDTDGAWAASGAVLPHLLAVLMAEPYLHKAPPKSTGRDLFNAAWLAACLRDFSEARAVDVQATLTEFTATACALAFEPYAGAASWPHLIVCGGGALNSHLMRRIQALLPSARVAPSNQFGLPPLEVEATAFAWLARKTLRRETGSLERVTGARGARILGAVYPA